MTLISCDRIITDRDKNLPLKIFLLEIAKAKRGLKQHFDKYFPD